MRRPGILTIVVPFVLLIIVIAAVSTKSQGAATASAAQPNTTGGASPSVSGHWVIMDSPNVGAGGNALKSVAANAPNDVTAVGSYFDASNHAHTLVEHWDGSAWSVVASPNPDPNSNQLSSVARDMAGGYWAAGSIISATHGPLVVRQTAPGAPWNLVPVPATSGYASLSAISANSPTDAWAVGNYTPGSYVQTLVMHWNGTQWSVVSSPNPSTGNNYLTDVVAVNADNIWVSGHTTAQGGYTFTPITLHCNGALVCTNVPFPNPGVTAQLRAITGRPGTGSSVELWTSGYYSDGTSLHGLVARGDGASWTLVSPTQPYVLNDIFAPSFPVPGLDPGPVIAAGDNESGSPIGPSAILSSTLAPGWQPIPPEYEGTGTDLFFGLTGPPGGSLFAVGYFEQGGIDRTQIEEFVLQPTTPTPTSPPPSPTPTCGDAITPGPSPTPYLSASLDSTYHTTLIAYNPNNPTNPGTIRDTTFANLMKFLLAPGEVSNSRDAKFLFQECFGGGMLSALRTSLGNSVKWVGGAASTLHEPSIGQISPAEATAYALQGSEVDPSYIDTIPGDYWTQSLGGPTFQDDTLLRALKGAKENDPRGTLETGQFISANGGETIRVSDSCATSHHAILWGGYATNMRHFHDVESMRDRLINAWGPPSGDRITIDVLFGDGLHKPDGTALPSDWGARSATELNLDTLVEHLATLMNPGEQFLFYASDHGSYEYVFAGGSLAMGSNVSPQASATPIPLPPGGQRQDSFTLTRQDLEPILHDPTSAPAIIISYSGSLDSNTAVSVSLNSNPIGYLQQGETRVTLPVSATMLTTTTANQVLLHSANSTTIYINEGSFWSGPVNNLPLTCTSGYSDVSPGSTFYNYVECLACGGMISGYSDDTFRPNNPVTRGQLSKIVSNASRFDETYTAATFVDVPVGSTFHQFVERLASRGIIAGYQCGGAGEPCPGTYFRPNNNVTRGQTSKIVAISNSLPAPTPGQQSFEDVSPSNTFWAWIEALAADGAINGYPCGGPGEPCGAGNRPFFRPANNVTRGQSSKIVSSSFFPACVAP